MQDLEFVRLVRALADPTRLRILRVVGAGESLCCGAISREVPVTPATISHHLRILSGAGLVEMRRDGQFIHVHANRRRLEELQAALGNVFCLQPVTAARSRSGRQGAA